MEYLVTMTTRVPDGTSEASVRDIRIREAARSGELAAQGHLLRLWRPPVRPGEWRTLGLFAADNDAGLEKDLASMPLRVWRTDEVTPLTPHPNDPPGRRDLLGSPAPGGSSTEFLTTWVLDIPPGIPTDNVDATTLHEAECAHQLAEQGYLLRLWRLPGEGRSLGLWRARDRAELQAMLASLPMNAWLRVQVTPLDPQPSDPPTTSRGEASL